MWKSEEKAAALQEYRFAGVLESMRRGDVRRILDIMLTDTPSVFHDELRLLAEDKTQGIKPIRAVGEGLLAMATAGLTILSRFFNDHPDYAV